MMWCRLVIDGNSVYEIDEECSFQCSKSRGQERLQTGAGSENTRLRGTQKKGRAEAGHS